MITYLKIMGPPILPALKALEKMAIDQPEVCIMDSLLSFDPGRGLDETSAYFGSFEDISEERCGTIISKSGIGLGKHDFYFEWFKIPTNQEFMDLLDQIDATLEPLGVRYSITTRGARRHKIDLSGIPLKASKKAAEPPAGGYFEVYQGKDKQWRFRLKAANHQIIAVGEAYNTKSGCMNGIRSVKENAANSETYDLTE